MPACLCVFLPNINPCRQGQCCLLVDGLREFQSLKSSIGGIVEKASSVAEIRSALKDAEDIRRALSRVRTQHSLALIKSGRPAGSINRVILHIVYF